MALSKEAVGITSLYCHGATGKDLETPVGVAIDITAGRERGVSCPCLEEIPYENEKGQRRVSYRCTAGRITYNEFLASLDTTRPAEENFQALCNLFPRCTHKISH